MEPKLSAQITGLIRQSVDDGEPFVMIGHQSFTLAAALAAGQTASHADFDSSANARSSGWDLNSWIIDTMAKQGLVPYRSTESRQYVETSGRTVNFQLVDGAFPLGRSRRHMQCVADAADIKDALSLNQLTILYQPTVDLASGRIIEFEAILHWHHHGLGLIPLSDVDYPSTPGLSSDLTNWAFEMAAPQLAKWRSQYPAYSALGLSVRVCDEQLARHDALEHAAECMKENGLEPSVVTIQLDSAELLSSSTGAGKISNIRNAGFCVALDSFDAGIDAIAVVREYPIRTLRLSDEFAANVGRLTVDPSLSRSVIGLARSMNLRVVATGVDSAAQLKRLQSFGCDIAQGELFAKPLSVDELEPLLSQRAVFFHLVDALSDLPKGL